MSDTEDALRDVEQAVRDVERAVERTADNGAALQDIERAVGKVEDAIKDVDLRDLERAVEKVERAIGRVEEGIKDIWSVPKGIWVIVIAYIGWSLLGDTWHSKWRYALSYGVSSDKVLIERYPHDCDFLAAPLGTKYCRYERVVSTVRWATSATGNPIVSYDEGKTWSVFTPDANVTVPNYSAVEEVLISWKKTDE